MEMEKLKLTSSKDRLIFVSSKDLQLPSKYDMPPALPSEVPNGVKAPDGTINYRCPCLGTLPTGPCGYEFRQFFECINKIEDDDVAKENEDDAKEKKQECMESFTKMKNCFDEFPKLYGRDSDDLDEATTKLEDEKSKDA